MGDRSTVRIGGLCRDLPIRLGYEVFIIDAYISTLDDMTDVILGTPMVGILGPNHLGFFNSHHAFQALRLHCTAPGDPARRTTSGRCDRTDHDSIGSPSTTIDISSTNHDYLVGYTSTSIDDISSTPVLMGAACMRAHQRP
jgi:hypothetical protein